MHDDAHQPEDLLAFWFGPLDEWGRANATHARRWWMKDPAFDEALRARFGALHGAVAAGAREGWRATPRGLLAYVIVLDQLSRNLFRDTERMYAHDARALEVAEQGLTRGDAVDLGRDERHFLYMPLMHAESLPAQDRCVALFAAELAAAPEEERADLARSLDFAQRHRDIVARFGRFPHRNALLGRPSSAEEIAFLTEPGSSF
ncbi:MAG: DUF924 domain-containing protein [Deltaproteobacteria bacterium]|nr:MAG: DUF924 domain-containing protein [Deltaproteobacteria bacterium]